MLDKNTKQLENELAQARDLKKFLDDNDGNFCGFTLAGYLKHLLAEKNLNKAQVIRDSQLGPYAYHIFGGNKKTSREYILSLAFAMKLSPKETDYLLYYSGHEKLYPRSKWDSVIYFALTNRKNLLETNEMLAEWKLYPLLGRLD